MAEREVIINVKLKLASEDLAPAVEKVRTEISKLTPEQKKVTDEIKNTTESLRQAAAVEKECLELMRDQLQLEGKREAARKAQIDQERQILRLQEQQIKATENGGKRDQAAPPAAGSGGGGAATTPAKGTSAIAKAGEIGNAVQDVINSLFSGPEILKNLTNRAPGVISDLRGGREAFQNGTFTRSGAEFLNTTERFTKYGLNAFFSQEGLFGKYGFKPFETGRDKAAFGKELGYVYNNHPPAVPAIDLEIAARERLITKLNEETTLQQTRNSTTQSLVSSEYKRQHLDENLIRQSSRAYGTTTAQERNEAMMLAGIREQAGGLAGMNRDQRDAYLANRITGPLGLQEQEDEWRKGPDQEQRAFMSDLLRKTGLKDQVDNANQQTAIDLKIDPRISVEVGIQSFDTLVQELNDKLLPKMIQAFQEIIADADAKLARDVMRRRNSETYVNGRSAAEGF